MFILKDYIAKEIKEKDSEIDAEHCRSSPDKLAIAFLKGQRMALRQILLIIKST